MGQRSFHVMIVGGGLGGLCLAQGLKKAGISVAVYERDRTRNERLQGYRIHIEPMGNKSLHACLPPHLFDVYLKTSGYAGAGLLMYDEQLRRVISFPADPANENPLESSLSVSRITLRQVLLAELDECVHFDKCFSHYQENPDGSVTAFFEDGTSATGDLLVGAEGSNSRVRQQLLPEAKRLDTGVVALMGKVPLTPEVHNLLKVHQLDWASIILGPKGRSLFSAVHDLHDKADVRVQGSIGANEDALLTEESTLFENTSDYYFWAFVTKQKNYPRDPQQLSGDALLQIVQEMTAGWHPVIQQLLKQTPPETMLATPLRIASSVRPWDSQNITLLGDAIHSMPPTRGIGGNTALRDAELLCQKLVAVSRQEQTLPVALKEYVTEMLDYSFAAVRSSKQSLDMMVMENSVGRTLTRGAFRLMSFFIPQKQST